MSGSVYDFYILLQVSLSFDIVENGALYGTCEEMFTARHANN